MQISNIRDFTGCMTGNRHNHIIRMDTRAIIDHFNHPHAALGNMNRNLTRTSVYRVFKQLFNHGCWARYYLARCQLIDEQRR